ncbi:cyclase family protein [uncultured Sphaerochaeta sp.]|uniref:cyclase family protein n=1 Tax=uncultured Sphaerochaeta sp. TaxID=886478 RepID=UPI002A0A7AD1|nr:cyclase family protein [uncultured Sphaerochaeta sp.]
MQIKVIGIRLDQMTPSARTSFLFSPKQLIDATVKVKKQTNSCATVILCTCDRIEVWCLDSSISAYEPMCRELSLSPLAWKSYFYEKEGTSSVRYLYELACGLHSPLFGEDLIISQLRESILRSRQCGCTTSVLEQLFKGAITVAKKVQSTINLTLPEKTIALAVRHLLEIEGKVPSNLGILIIGSSGLARLVAQELLCLKVPITMTIRDLEKADFLIPNGVSRALYDERFSYFSEVGVVISATKGLGYTLCEGDATAPLLYIDLSNPPDIDPAVGKLAGKTLYTLKDLDCRLPEREKAVEQANRLIDQALDLFFAWFQARSKIAGIQEMSEEAANSLLFRLYAPLSHLNLDPIQLSEFRNVLKETARKAFAHELYAQGKMLHPLISLDLSHVLENSKASYPGDPDIVLETVATVEQEGYRVKKIQLGSHSGTHLDSPGHMFSSGKTLDEFSMTTFFAKGFVLDCKGVSVIDKELVKDIPTEITCVLFSTGWEAYWNTERYQAGFPLLNIEAVDFLLERGITLFGFDCMSCDDEKEEDFPIHRKILSKDCLVLENLCNLRTLVGKCIDLTALPLSVKDSDGCPARVVASFRD